MSKRFLASVLGLLVLLLAVSVATAAADTPPGVQTAGQSATSGQQAAAASGATQTQPSNTNISVRVLSPGNGGNVTQANTVSSTGTASNSNSANQSTSQNQSGPGGIQTSTQSAGNSQLAAALSYANQVAPTNTNLVIRVGSSGNDGSVNQANTVSSDASSKNDNDTQQTADQSQVGASPCACATPTAPIQTSDQSAGNDQKGLARSGATQRDASNVNLPIRVGSTGNGGNVTQANDVSSEAKAKNDNDLHQSSDQTNGVGSGTGVQTANQSAGNDQAAAAASSATQDKPKNVNISVRVLSPGDDGNVSQANSVSSEAKAKNDNDTSQSVDQSQTGKSSCGCASTPAIQTADQWAGSKQAALSLSKAEQTGASNVNAPIRVGSSGNGGNVSQSNAVESESKAKNDNDTSQSVDQDLATGGSCGCAGSTGVQTAKQAAGNEQAALALSKADQDFGKSDCGCHSGGNSNAPVRVGSSGNDGNVSQSNAVESEAKAKNDNDLDQSAVQDAAGGSGTGVQTADQWAGNAQLAAAASAAEQKGASNSNAPIRVKSSGDGGSVSQSNDVSSESKAKNDNDTSQRIHQDPSRTDGHDCGCSDPGPVRTPSPGGHDCGCADPIRTSPPDGHDCGCSAPTGIQTAKQGARNEQAGFALSKAEQSGAKNENAPIRVGSSGNDGNVSQSNAVESEAKAKNDNDLDQSVTQDAAGGSGTGVQTADQWAGNAQLAGAASLADQHGASNKNAPVRVGSSGDGGTVVQSNDASSEAKAKNDNDTSQSVDQNLATGGSCGCAGPTGVQTAKQSAGNEQAALALSKADQDFGKSDCGCHSGGNSNAPVRVGSSGNDGNVSQSNAVESEAKSKNDNDLHQSLNQDQSGASGTGIQTGDQSATNAQFAAAASQADQKGAKNSNAPLRVGSSGDGGRVVQSNDASSEAKAKNDNDTHQDAGQNLTSRGDCGCASAIGVQALGQKAVNTQAALAASAAVQDFGRSDCGCHSAGNSNAPVRVGSSGNDGSVSQSNAVESEAKAKNDNDLDQSAAQDVAGASGIGIQALGQEAWNDQAGAAFSGAFQPGASNRNKPVSVHSSGDGGSVEQGNDASSEAEALNRNRTPQDAHQTLRGSSGCPCGSPIDVQALGQSARNGQKGFGLSNAGQAAPSDTRGVDSVYSAGNDGAFGQFNNDKPFADSLNRDRAEMLARHDRS